MSIRTIYHYCRSGLLSLAALIGLACVVVFVGALALNVRPLVVISGSMEPTVPVGSVVFSERVPASEAEPGDIVTVQRPRNLGLVTHRLVSSELLGDGVYEYVLRGDANDTDDPQPYEVDSVGLYKAHVPWLGHISMALRSSGGLLIAAAVALLLIAVYLVDPGVANRRASPQEFS